MREYCNAGEMAGRIKTYPEHPEWKKVAGMITDFSQTFGTMELLVNLAMGRVKDSPFSVGAVRSLKNGIISELESLGFSLGRQEEDRPDLPVDFRFMDQLMRSAHDPDRSIGKFARGVKVMIPKRSGDRIIQLLMGPPRRSKKSSKRGQIVKTL